MMAKQYDQEYKTYVCRLVIEEGRKIAELARELNISRSALSNWLRAYKEQTGWYEAQAELRAEEERHAQQQALRSLKTASDYEHDIKQLQKELERINEENAILKKAMHVFTQVRE